MSATLRVLRSTELRSASAPMGAALWRGSLVVAAADLEAETAALWLVDDGRVVGASPLPLSQIADLVAEDDDLIITGSSAAAGQHHVLVGYSPVSTGQQFEPDTHGDLVREPRCVLTPEGAVIFWEEYVGPATTLVTQHLRRPARDWQLDWPAVRGPARPFTNAARTVWGPSALVEVRVNENGSASAELLDEDLAVRAELRFAEQRRHLAAIGGRRVVVAHSGAPGQPVLAQELDLNRAEAAEPITVPIEKERATVGAVALAPVGNGPLVILVTVETLLDDPELVDQGSGPELRHPHPQTTERCIAVNLNTGGLSNSIVVDPPSYGGGALVCSSDRVYLVHGSSPLYVTEFALEDS